MTTPHQPEDPKDAPGFTGIPPPPASPAPREHQLPPPTPDHEPRVDNETLLARLVFLFEQFEALITSPYPAFVREALHDEVADALVAMHNKVIGVGEGATVASVLKLSLDVGKIKDGNPPVTERGKRAADLMHELVRTALLTAPTSSTRDDSRRQTTSRLTTARDYQSFVTSLIGRPQQIFEKTVERSLNNGTLDRLFEEECEDQNIRSILGQAMQVLLSDKKKLGAAFTLVRMDFPELLRQGGSWNSHYQNLILLTRREPGLEFSDTATTALVDAALYRHIEGHLPFFCANIADEIPGIAELEQAERSFLQRMGAWIIPINVLSHQNLGLTILFVPKEFKPEHVEGIAARHLAQVTVTALERIALMRDVEPPKV